MNCDCECIVYFFVRDNISNETFCCLSSTETGCEIATWTLLVISQNNCEHKNLLGNEQWRDVDSIQHCE